MVSDTCSLKEPARLLYKGHFSDSCTVAQSRRPALSVTFKETRAMQPVATCRQSPYLHKPAIVTVTSFSQPLFSLLRHSLLSWPRPVFGRTYVRTDALPRLIYNDSRRRRLIQRTVVSFASSVDWGHNYRNSILPRFQDIKYVWNLIFINKQLLSQHGMALKCTRFSIVRQRQFFYLY